MFGIIEVFELFPAGTPRNAFGIVITRPRLTLRVRLYVLEESLSKFYYQELCARARIDPAPNSAMPAQRERRYIHISDSNNKNDA